VSARGITEALEKIAGSDHVIDDGPRLAAEAVDGTIPRWVVRLSGVEQVAAVLALASEESLAVTPRGSGSALGLGRPPARVDVVLDLSGMNRIVDYSPDDLTASVEAGLTGGALATRLAPQGQFLPLDPPGVASRTLGGLVATAAHGPLRARHGSLRDFLLGVRFVQADGVVTWGGARVVKSVTGYDVPKLMVGSLGTLGVLCELTLRLHPRPAAEATRLLTFDTIEAAAACVAQVLDSSVEPSRVEFLNGPALARLGIEGRGPAGIAISVGSVEAAVRDEIALVERMACELGGRGHERSLAFWDAYGATLDASGHAVALHLSIPPSDLARAADVVERLLADLAPDETAVVAGSAAVGTLEVLLSTSAVAVAAPLVERLREAVAGLDGHVTIRRAPAAVRRAVDPWGSIEPGPLALMRALRDEFDPRRVLNPGLFVV
jgi:glycolate oxidase FAD binding subunit